MEQKNKITVFDFDKTLTRRDTILGYYLFCNKNVTLLYKLPAFCFCIAFKLVKIITLKQLKSAGVFIFLKGKTKEHLDRQGKAYSEKIKLNRIYRDFFLPVKDDALVISASYNEYLKHLFPASKAYGSTLLYTNGVVSGLGFHMYGRDKLTFVEALKITGIDVFYTDSFSDKPLMDISRKVYLVKGDRVSILNK